MTLLAKQSFPTYPRDRVGSEKGTFMRRNVGCRKDEWDIPKKQVRKASKSTQKIGALVGGKTNISLPELSVFAELTSTVETERRMGVKRELRKTRSISLGVKEDLKSVPDPHST